MEKLFITILIIFMMITACSRTPEGEVVIYTALDEIFSRPILDDFEKSTGIKVKMLTDTEATKTVGLVNRLIAEKDHPQADVFWNNEIGRTLALKQKGVLAPYFSPAAQTIPAHFKDPEGYWTGFAARARVILYNTDLIKEDEAPSSIFALTRPVYRGKVAIAKPLFGTTATHAAVLFAVLGEAKAKKYFMDLKANDCIVAAGNAMARNMVMNGEVPICLTDTDDANGALLKNKPVRMIYPDQGRTDIGTLVIPNSVVLIKNCPHPENGKKLIEYIVSAEVEQKLAKSPSAQLPIRPGLKPYSALFDLKKIKSMEVDYNQAVQWLDPSAKFIQSEFLK
ncbi:MAG: extracellular solute-binding protein [Planctomycetes bacterium]|nr:extracellular solute-binding protein [Planctomycetota bacterium]